MTLAALQAKARRIKLLITDCDGVLTDNGVYYSERGEEMKRFSIRDGMAVERLRHYGIESGIMTGETSPSVQKRADKLRITELHLGIKDKPCPVARNSGPHRAWRPRKLPTSATTPTTWKSWAWWA